MLVTSVLAKCAPASKGKNACACEQVSPQQTQPQPQTQGTRHRNHTPHLSISTAGDAAKGEWHAPRAPTPRFRTFFSPPTLVDTYIPAVPPLSFFAFAPDTPTGEMGAPRAISVSGAEAEVMGMMPAASEKKDSSVSALMLELRQRRDSASTMEQGSPTSIYSPVRSPPWNWKYPSLPLQDSPRCTSVSTSSSYDDCIPGDTWRCLTSTSTSTSPSTSPSTKTPNSKRKSRKPDIHIHVMDYKSSKLTLDTTLLLSPIGLLSPLLLSPRYMLPRTPPIPGVAHAETSKHSSAEYSPSVYSPPLPAAPETSSHNASAYSPSLYSPLLSPRFMLPRMPPLPPSKTSHARSETSSSASSSTSSTPLLSTSESASASSSRRPSKYSSIFSLHSSSSRSSKTTLSVCSISENEQGEQTSQRQDENQEQKQDQKQNQAPKPKQNHTPLAPALRRAKSSMHIHVSHTDSDVERIGWRAMTSPIQLHFQSQSSSSRAGLKARREKGASMGIVKMTEELGEEKPEERGTTEGVPKLRTLKHRMSMRALQGLSLRMKSS